MATTINNTSVNSRLTIIFDANGDLDGNGPAKGSGNTESDVYLDSKIHYNIRSHTEIDSSIHALQWDAATNTGHIEYINNNDNDSITTVPQWATNVVIRCEAEDIRAAAYTSNLSTQQTAWTDAGNQLADFVQNTSTANTHADSERDTYLSAHSITY